MAKKKNNPADAAVADYRHQNRRKHIPPAGLAAQGKIQETPKLEFVYNPHLPPVLRSDPTGKADQLPELLQEATTRKLSKEEARMLAEALRNHEPWLEWSGKQEKKAFTVEPVALHIHERISTQAILKVAAREDVQRDLFADPELEYKQAIQFYQHDVDWSNRMILGDSLQVMASLARRENLAGKVQMIYVDPPYGIKFASNFQPEIGRRDVKDKESDLTREPEMVKAYRDTWTLGVHSYLAYLRDRLILARELLTDSGSVFVQISDENLHRVRAVMDEVFLADNFVAVIAFKKTGYQASDLLPSNCDYLLWYARDKERLKYRQLNVSKLETSAFVGQDLWYEERNGWRRRLTKEEADDLGALDPAAMFRHKLAESSGAAKEPEKLEFESREFMPKHGKHFSSNPPGMERVKHANRFLAIGNTLRYVNYLADFSVTPITTNWADTVVSGFSDPQRYVVQTSTKVIERCLLMTTDPGDLVLDPTCGSGTTAFVAEQWGRRWITMDTSRVALALARQRLLTAKFDFYKLREDAKGVGGGFVYKSVPHITLKSIAQNVALDPIFAKHQPVLDAKLKALNDALKKVPADVRQKLNGKLLEKEKREGKKAVTDADRRRWILPRGFGVRQSSAALDAATDRKRQRAGAVQDAAAPDESGGWREWEVPFDTDPDWPGALQSALKEYRAAWRAKMDEVNACIAASAEQEELVDKPEVVKGVVRVSGPFTMESTLPDEEDLDVETPIGGAPEPMETFVAADVSPLTSSSASPESQSRLTSAATEPVNAEAYLDKMLNLLRADGIRFPNNKVAKFSRLEAYQGEFLHAEGDWTADNGKERKVAVSFGPQHGSVTTFQVENALHQASKRGFDDLVFAGFSFDASAQATIQDDPNPRVRCHLAHIRPDVNMGDLLKTTSNAQIFTVFGTPRTDLRKTKDGMFEVEMQGVDVYNPVDNTILPTSAAKVAAWFLDTDYDGRTFCITQAFFPDKSAWDKLANALKGSVNEDRFAALSGTVSLPFPAGKNKRAAVKVIDPRGNEVMRVHRLNGKVKYD